jgi:hypothetical protein
MTMAADLKSLLVDLTGMDAEAIEKLARSLYSELYLNRGKFGLHSTHDGHTLIFHADAFDHAFFTTSDRICHPESKDKIRTGSIERIRWIGCMVRGIVPGSACFEVPSPTGRYRPPNRLYVVVDTPYVVWLEPRKDTGWKLRSAYPLSIEEIRNYTGRGRTVWKHKENSPVIKPAHGATSLVQTD